MGYPTHKSALITPAIKLVEACTLEKEHLQNWKNETYILLGIKSLKWLVLVYVLLSQVIFTLSFFDYGYGLSAGDGETIRALHGFYGNPLYR